MQSVAGRLIQGMILFYFIFGTKFERTFRPSIHCSQTEEPVGTPPQPSHWLRAGEGTTEDYHIGVVAMHQLRLRLFYLSLVIINWLPSFAACSESCEDALSVILPRRAEASASASQIGFFLAFKCFTILLKEKNKTISSGNEVGVTPNNKTCYSLPHQKSKIGMFLELPLCR